jgi:membrane-associated phospholipid phosphatase
MRRYIPKTRAGWIWAAISLSSITLIVVCLWFNDLLISRYLVSQAAKQNYLHTFADFMDRSLFNGESFGGQDISYFLVSPFFVFYLLCMFSSGLRNKFRDTDFYKNSGFIFSCSLVLFIVCRSLKTFFRRVRPDDLGKVVDNVVQDYSGMWMVGSQKLSVAVSKGSFISGHTTTAAVIIALAYLVYSSKRPWISRLTVIVSVFWAVLLGLGRVYSGDHYPSDIFWSVVVSFVLIKWIYKDVLKLDLQKKGLFVIEREKGELFWSLYFVLFSLSLLFTTLAIESFVVHHQWLGLLALFPGVTAARFSYRKMRVTIKEYASGRQIPGEVG